MLFNSPVYIFLFLPIVVFVYFYLNVKRQIAAAKTWLVLSSLFFYGYWNSAYLILIIGSMLVNYQIGTSLHKSKATAKHKGFSRRNIFIAGIVFNLSLLGYFKYVNFFLVNISYLTGTDVPLLELALPLAISFFTFQQIAYIVDSYQEGTREYDFLNYALFVTFFPQLIAGPIVHHREMMPQFFKLRTKIVNWKNIYIALFIFSLGLFKKVVIADYFSGYADAGFGSNQMLSFIEAWGTSLSYTLQLYYDFSGYSDMAIGTALLFNIKLPVNFNSPYKSYDIQDFWRRWHLTLSRWLRDYVYIPLGGNRLGNFRTYNNLFATFLIGGLWHGAGWTFVIWGAMHGIAIIINRVWKRVGIPLQSTVAWFITFMFVNLSWVFFRAETFESAMFIIGGMTDFSSIQLSREFIDEFSRISGFNINLNIDRTVTIIDQSNISEWAFLSSIVIIILSVLMKNTLQLVSYVGERMHLSYRMFYLSLVLFSYSVFTMLGSKSEVFLYFNF